MKTEKWLLSVSGDTHETNMKININVQRTRDFDHLPLRGESATTLSRTSSTVAVTALEPAVTAFEKKPMAVPVLCSRVVENGRDVENHRVVSRLPAWLFLAQVYLGYARSVVQNL